MWQTIILNRNINISDYFNWTNVTYPDIHYFGKNKKFNFGHTMTDKIKLLIHLFLNHNIS